VLHRDVKPSNLLVDTLGHLWVTDFGLARLQGEAGLTLTGDLLGTLRYMSPEQALAKRVVIDHRTDVYSLGATLYELATLHPVFAGEDRQELLRQIAFAEPRSVRKVNSAVPRELETVVLKALSKDPAGRYASAQEMADDLRRFLEDRPLRARRPTVLERAVKWSRRHTTVVVSAVALLMMAVAGLSVGIVLIGKQQARTEKVAEELKTERDRVTRAADDLSWQGYVSRVNLAYREVLDDNVGSAEFLLFNCPRKFRGWEWHYVMRLSHLDRLTFRGHRGSANAVAISPDGRWVASGAGAADSDGRPGSPAEVKLWDVTDGRERLALGDRDDEKLDGAVTGVSISPDGRFVAVAGGYYMGVPRPQGRLSLWDASTGRRVWVDEDDSGAAAVSVKFLPGGDALAAGYRGFFRKDSPGFIKFFDAASGRELPRYRIEGPAGGVASITTDPDGRRIALAGLRRIEVWDWKSHRQMRSWIAHDLLIYRLTFNHDGTLLASAGRDMSIRLWDPETGAEVRRLLGHKGYIYGLAFSPDGTLLASAGEDRSVRLWEVATGRELGIFHGHFVTVYDVAFHPDGRRLLSSDLRGEVKVWDVAKSLPVVFNGHSGPVSGVAFRRDGRRVASQSQAKVLFSINIDPLNADGTTRAWDPETGREEDPGVAVDDRESGPWGQAGILHAVSPDGKRLVVGSATMGVRLYEMEPRRSIAPLFGHTRGVLNIAFTPDGTRVATVSWDRTIKLWDAATGRELLTLYGHTAGINCLAFSPDAHGNRLVSGGIDSTARVWDATPLPDDFLREREADRLGSALTFTAPFKEEAVEKLRNDPNLDESTRVEVLRAYERWWPRSASRLWISAREIVSFAGASPEAYQRALRQAEAAVRLAPDSLSARGTRGIALYRVGQYREALEILLSVDKGRTELIPSNTAFLAMAYRRLGRPAEARERLAQLRDELRPSAQGDDPNNQAMLHEAEALIEPEKSN
jgi:WD40 repeat protein